MEQGLEQLRRPPHLEARDHDELDRLYHDTATWLAEVLPGQMRTAFEYSFDGQELYGRDGGALKPIFDTAIVDAKRIANRNPNLSFELRRRYIEKGEYNDMIAMERGELPNTMVVVSDSPQELENATYDIGGYNVSRKQTMLRIITKQTDGTLVMYSQSLDRSDRQSLEAIYNYLGYTPEPGELLGQRMHIDLPEQEQEFLIDWLTGIYDRSMSKQYGGNWYAGRTPAEVRNTYNFVCEQRDLIETFMQLTILHGHNEDLRYGLAAAMVKRFRNNTSFKQAGSIEYQPALVLNEIGGAGQQARLEGKSFSGCGVTSGPEGAQAASELEDAGYGNKTSEETSYKFDKEMHCVVCQPRPRRTEPKKMCGPCGICKTCDTKIRKAGLN